MNIKAVGQKRFRIVTLDTELPYLRGQVQPYPLSEDDPPAQARLADRLRPWIVRYLADLSRLGNVELESQNLPDEPVALAYAAAALLQTPAEEKQALLNIAEAATLLADLRAIYRREIAILKVMGQAAGQTSGKDLARDQGSFSLN